MRLCFLATLLVACLSQPASADDSDCAQATYCIEDQTLRVQVEDLRIRGTVANFNVRLTNLSGGELVTEARGAYLAATSFEGEQIRLSRNLGDRSVIAAGQNRLISYSIKFEDDLGGGLDLWIRFSMPSVSYSTLI